MQPHQKSGIKLGVIGTDKSETLEGMRHMKFLKSLIPTTMMAIAISACGGGPDVDQVRADFENPSGSTKDKNGVIAASGKQEASDNSALSLAGGGVPGLGLTATTQKGFEKIGPMRFIAPQLRRLGATSQALRVSQDDDIINESCIDNADELAEALADADVSGGGDEVELSFTIEVGDASKCSSNLSGAFSISYDLKVTATTQQIEAEAKYNNVCDSDTGSCLDGSMIIAGNFDNTSGSSEMLMAWDFTSQYTDEDGKSQTIATKGGIRMTNTATESTIEFLQYVRNSDGEEVSYVLKLGANVNGDVSLDIRGTDGELVCQFSESTGTGTCSGMVDGESFDLSWSEDEYDSVTESDEFLDG